MVIKGGVGDAAECGQLANSVALVRGLGSSSQGFLMGTESASDYTRMFTEGLSLVARDPQGDIVGYVIGYPWDSKIFTEIFTEERVRKLGIETLLEQWNPFYIDKVFVASHMRRQGLAQTIYHHLFSELSSATMLAFIVEGPTDNIASRKFHAAQDFTKIGELFLPKVGPLENVVEGLWMRPANELA